MPNNAPGHWSIYKETNNQFEPWYAQAQTAKFSSGPCHTEFIIKIRGIHISKARSNALFVNNSPSHGAYTCTCTESRSVLFEYLKLICSSHVSVKLCGILSNVHTICFHFFSKRLYSQQYNQLFVHRLAILSKKKAYKIV